MTSTEQAMLVEELSQHLLAVASQCLPNMPQETFSSTSCSQPTIGWILTLFRHWEQWAGTSR